MRWAAACLLLLACTRTARPPVCVPGDSCAPSDPCRGGAISCDPQIACIATDAGTRDGTACGTGRVCSAGECVLCAEGSACTPAGDPCHAGILGCSTGQPVCTASLSPAPDGTPCGVDLACAATACAPGDGADGALIYSGTAPLEPARSTASGQAGATLLTLGSSAGFAAGQQLFIHQTQGTDAGHWEEAQVVAVASDTTLSLAAPLQHTYGAGAQVLVERRFTDFTVPASATLSPLPWDGKTGGIVAFKARGTVRIDGRISLSGLGYRGGAAQASAVDYVDNQQGESIAGFGPARDPGNSAPSGDGGGSGCGAGGGGGGGHGSSGKAGVFQPAAPADRCISGCGGATLSLGQGGGGAGQPDLSLAVPGGGGGASGSQGGSGRDGAPGGGGGGLIFIHAGAIEVIGRIDANGANGGSGYNAATQPVGGGGGGAGGGIRLVAGSVHIIGPVTAVGGSGGAQPVPATGSCIPAGTGGAGGDGRIFLSAPDLQGSTTPLAATATAP
jgi:hypothetical protein